MDEKSFLPDEKPVFAHVLANVQYRRDDLAKITEGADLSSISVPDNIEPLWGLLYTCADGIGFFVHPNEGQLAFLFRSGQSGTPKPVHLEIPYASIVKTEMVRPREPKTKIGKFLRKYSSAPSAVFAVTWTRADKECTIRFFISTGADVFAKSFEEKK